MNNIKIAILSLLILSATGCSSSGGGGGYETNVTSKPPVDKVLVEDGKELTFNNSTDPKSLTANKGDILRNKGTIKIMSDTLKLKAKDGGEINNSASGTITGEFSTAIVADGSSSKAINSGKIIVSDKVTHSFTKDDGSKTEYNGGEGLVAINGASASNEKGAEIINGESGVITVNIRRGMTANGDGSKATNNGLISSDGVKSSGSGIFGGEGMKASHAGYIENGKDGIIQGKLRRGMIADGSKSEAQNNGTINLDMDNAIGMIARNSATAINNTTGIINLNPDSLYEIGMEANDNSATVKNYGTINAKLKGTQFSDHYGMVSNNGATAINEETGVISGHLEVGMVADELSSKAINHGKISLMNSKDGMGMGAFSGGNIENGKTGIIEGVKLGMTAEHLDSKATNNGIINIDMDNGVGMKALDKATAINGVDGVINLNASNGIGMLADGKGSLIENYGTIKLSGLNISDPDGRDSKSNIGMVIRNEGRMVNKGKIIY